MLIGLPRYYGIWLSFVMELPQHTGSAEDVLDHRLNARTIMMGPVLRFIYSNMNYHIEHHMFPMVPYHRLPALHVVIKHDCPPPYRSLWQVWVELLPLCSANCVIPNTSSTGQSLAIPFRDVS